MAAGWKFKVQKEAGKKVEFNAKPNGRERKVKLGRMDWGEWVRLAVAAAATLVVAVGGEAVPGWEFDWPEREDWAPADCHRAYEEDGLAEACDRDPVLSLYGDFCDSLQPYDVEWLESSRGPD